MARRFEGKVALVTGASSGIGAAVARQLAMDGAKVVLAARREERLHELVQEIEGMGCKALPVVCDVTKEDDLKRLVALTHDNFGLLDIVVVNAGFCVIGSLEQLSVQDFRRQLETNVFGSLETIKATLADLQQTRGRLAIMSSVMSHAVLPWLSAYAMSKAALHALAETLRPELHPSGISVTLFTPGFVDSEIRKIDNTGALHPETQEDVPRWLVMPAPKAAQQISKALYKRKRHKIITWHAWALMWLCRLVPGVYSKVVQWLRLTGTQVNEPQTQSMQKQDHAKP